jgi:Flp pilus assembly pilin Flp
MANKLEGSLWCWRKTKSFFGRTKQEGAALVEYALLVAVIAMGCYVGISTLGNDLARVFRSTGNIISNIPTISR